MLEFKIVEESQLQFEKPSVLDYTCTSLLFLQSLVTLQHAFYWHLPVRRNEVCLVVVVVVVITPPLPRDGGTARTAIQVYAVNLIEIRLGERWQPISNQS